MFSIGLTGGIGSGKSLVADRLHALGADVIDTDVIAHALTGAGGAAMDAIRAAFGGDFVRADGALDRARMRARVFADQDARTQLQAILHPMIRQEAEDRVAQAQGAYTVFVVPLLVESGAWRTRVARVCVVDCGEDVQRARVVERSGLTPDEITRIMQSQATRAERLAAADDVIHNDQGVSVAQLQRQVEGLHAHWCALARVQRPTTEETQPHTQPHPKAHARAPNSVKSCA